jgi:putative hydrolase of the HAD superfamily
MIPAGLILDYGEVLVDRHPHASLEALASIAGLPLDELVARYWRHRDDYDAGLPAADYWQRVLDGAAPAPAGQIAQLIDEDVRSWTHYREDVWQVAADFRDRGGRTAMLSNGVPEIIGRARLDRQLDRYFDAVIVSCEVGCAKPSPEIYRICLEDLGTPAGSSLFVDDRRENLDAAERAGIRTLHFTGRESVEPLRALLGM